MILRTERLNRTLYVCITSDEKMDLPAEKFCSSSPYLILEEKKIFLNERSGLENN